MTVEHYLGGARDDADHVDEAGQLEALPYGAHSGSLVAPPFFTMRLQRTRSNEVQTVAMLKYGLRVAVKPTHQGAAVLSGPASVAAATARVSSSERLDAAPRVESSAKVIVVENEKGKHSPEPVLIRVYVLSGHALAPVRAPSAPLGGLGGLVPLASLGIDTYLSAHLGGDTRLARAKTIDGSFEPLYHQFFEFETQLPGDGRVRLSVIERFAAPWLDEEIGYTEIDVEDRCPPNVG
ncbi:hypothetical protein T492DRAFT_872946 [Pavlovales sp. CCMP2436]|nr:hypothetical protein T492DRAFT_872946 [Pavlovales sp. CCMP2436]